MGAWNVSIFQNEPPSHRGTQLISMDSCFAWQATSATLARKSSSYSLYIEIGAQKVWTDTATRLDSGDNLLTTPTSRCFFHHTDPLLRRLLGALHRFVWQAISVQPHLQDLLHLVLFLHNRCHAVDVSSNKRTRIGMEAGRSLLLRFGTHLAIHHANLPVW